MKSDDDRIERGDLRRTLDMDGTLEILYQAKIGFGQNMTMFEKVSNQLLVGSK